MGRWFVFLCVFSFSSFFCAHFSKSDLDQLYRILKDEQYEQALSYFAENTMNLRELEQVARDFPKTPFQKAVIATKKIFRREDLSSKLEKDVFSAIYFIETGAQRQIEAAVYYWDKAVSGLEIEYDPQTQNFFIHLPKATTILGRGRHKSVSKTIFYKMGKARLCAYATMEFFIGNEIASLQSLKHIPHVLSVVSFLSHQDPNTKATVFGIVTNFYNGGSLNAFSRREGRISLAKKIQIVCDCIAGLEGMHNTGFVHRDLHLKNFFYKISNRRDRYHGCIGDLGRAISIEKARKISAQGSDGYCAPEAIFKENLKGEDYFRTDLFAFGTAMWKFLYKVPPAWSQKKISARIDLPSSEKYTLLCAEIRQEHEKLRTKIDGSNELQMQIAALLIKWTDPDPEKRGTTLEAKEAFIKLRKAL